MRLSWGLFDLIMRGGITVWILILVSVLSVGVIISLAVELFPAASDVVVFVLLAAVLLVRPRGLFGVEGLLSR